MIFATDLDKTLIYSHRLVNEKNEKLVTLVDEKDGIIRGNHKAPCIVCGKKTSFIDIDFEVYVCSEGCRREYTIEYMRWIKD